MNVRGVSIITDQAFGARTRSQSLVRFALIAITALVIAGCNNGQRKAKSYSYDRAYQNLENMTLSKVLRNERSPADTLDLIGDGSGQLGRPCTKIGQGANDGTGPSTCKCAFFYNLGGVSGSGDTPIFADTVYYEKDLIRCKIPNAIPPSVVQYNISVQYAGANQYSNEVVFQTQQSQGIAASPVDENTFAKVYRYQCTDVITVTHNFWGQTPTGRIYDRDLSEDPRLTTPMNYYTTNLGGAVALASRTGSGWDCPSNPLDTAIQYPNASTAGAAAVTAALNQQPGDMASSIPLGQANGNPAVRMLAKYDMRIGSLADDWIFPRVAGEDRHTFYLAKSPTGVFTSPVNSMIAPNRNTDPTGQNGTPPIGYAAFSNPNYSQGESCPADVPLPAGYEWAKLWLFHASFEYRTQPTVDPSIAFQSHPQFAPINDKMFILCSSDPSKNAIAYSANYSSYFPATPANNNLYGSDCQNINAANAPLWRAVAYEGKWGIASSDAPTAACMRADNPNGIASESNTAPRAGIVTTPLDAPGSRARFDYIYVVTPTSINSSQMQSKSQEALKYYPTRLLSSIECRSDNLANCASARHVPPYQLIQRSDIGENLDALQNQMGRPYKFPLCVLRKTNP